MDQATRRLIVTNARVMKVTKLTSCLLALLLSLTAQAKAQTQPLKSFAYASIGCTAVSGAPLLVFGPNNQWKMGPGYAPSGAGPLPSINFWIRSISVTFFNDGAVPQEWAIVGHSGPGGDWVSPAVVANYGAVTKDYPSDAAPLFTLGEYLDFHVFTCDHGERVVISVWYVPA